ncbi:MAG: lipoprotein [Clostridia bacterium]|nr:lipoprotein [Clostridia bacterium]
MKKLLCAFLSVFILSSCNRVDFQPDFPLCPEGQVEVLYSETVYKADIYFENDMLDLKIVQPDALKGFEITVTPTEISVVNSSLKLKYDKNKTEELFPITQIYDILIQLNTLKPEFKDNNGKLVAYFDVNGNECNLILNKQSKRILEVEYKKLVFKFTT